MAQKSLAKLMRNLKSAAQLRKMGASELMLASLTGSYPPPHKEMDEHHDT